MKTEDTSAYAASPIPITTSATAANFRRGPADNQRQKKRVEKTGDFAQRLDVAQLVWFNAQPLDDEVVKQGQLHPEEHTPSQLRPTAKSAKFLFHSAKGLAMIAPLLIW